MEVHNPAPVTDGEILTADRAESIKPVVQTSIIPRYPQMDIKPPMIATETACESIMKILLTPNAIPISCGSTSFVRVAELNE